MANILGPGDSWLKIKKQRERLKKKEMTAQFLSDFNITREDLRKSMEIVMLFINGITKELGIDSNDIPCKSTINNPQANFSAEEIGQMTKILNLTSNEIDLAQRRSRPNDENIKPYL